jgi:tetratricopeptide (TPR) repeat protein
MPPRSRPRRWTALPVPTLHGAEMLDQGVVLDELRSPLGLALWQALRDALLWSQTAPGERAELFAGRVAEVGSRFRTMLLVRRAAPELQDAVGVYAHTMEAPAQMQPAMLAQACGVVRDWAEDRGQLGTALAFAQAAAVADPSDAMAAWAAGRLARRRADHYRASGWFSQAMKRGRDGAQWEAYAAGLAGHGVVAMQLGNLPRAERYFLRALTACRNYGVGQRAPRVLHDLMVVALQMGDFEKAQRAAKRALNAYAFDDPNRILFIHDMAFMWMEQGRFRAAITVLQRIATLWQEPSLRILVSGNIARAAGACGLADTFIDARSETLAVLPGVADLERRATALLDLARGAGSLGWWGDAEELATGALRQVVDARIGRLRFTAEDLIASIRNERKVSEVAFRENDRATDELVDACVRRLPAAAST